MIFANVKRVLIVGLGLLGGSYARSLHKKGFAVDAITLEQESIDFAIQHGFIDRGSTTVEPSLIAEADLIVFALYPHVFVEWIEQNQSLFKRPPQYSRTSRNGFNKTLHTGTYQTNPYC